MGSATYLLYKFPKIIFIINYKMNKLLSLYQLINIKKRHTKYNKKYTRTPTHAHTLLHNIMINRMNLPSSIEGISCHIWVDTLKFSSYSDVIWISNNTDRRPRNWKNVPLTEHEDTHSRLLLPCKHLCDVLPFVPLIICQFLQWIQLILQLIL